MAIYDVNGNIISDGNTATFVNDYYADIEDVVAVPNYPSHDTTFVNGNIWAFDKPTDGGAFKVYNPTDFSVVKSLTHSFYYPKKGGGTAELEMKSVDWNAVNSVLAVGNGASTYTEGDSYIYLFYNALNWLNMTAQITFSNCGTYTQLDVSALGIKPYGFWAGKSEQCDQMFVVVNRFADVYLIHLGKGTVNLGSGTYAYIDADSYNGTYAVIKHWHQTVNETEPYGAHGGQFYKGSLYLADSDQSKCRIYRCVLTDDEQLKFDVIDCSHFRNGANNLIYRYLDGMCINEGICYSAPLYINDSYNTKTNKVVLKIALGEVS